MPPFGCLEDLTLLGTLTRQSGRRRTTASSTTSGAATSSVYVFTIGSAFTFRHLRKRVLSLSPGSTVGACSKEESFASIAKAINQAHREVPEVITVIENMVSLAFKFHYREIGQPV